MGTKVILHDPAFPKEPMRRMPNGSGYFFNPLRPERRGYIKRKTALHQDNLVMVKNPMSDEHRKAVKRGTRKALKRIRIVTPVSLRSATSNNVICERDRLIKAKTNLLRIVEEINEALAA